MINKRNILYARKQYVLGDFYYWKVLVRFIGDKRETCVFRTFDEELADEFIEELNTQSTSKKKK